MKQSATVCVAGGRRVVGMALRRALGRRGFARVVPAGDEPDWTDAGAVDAFFARTRPAYVLLAGGRSGGIRANQRHPASLMRDTLLVACHVLEAARRHGVEKLLFLASSCSYPRDAAQPMAVSALMSGAPEPTNAAYAAAQRAALELCRAYRAEFGLSVVTGIPADVFGPHDDFEAEGSHVVPALIRKLHAARRDGARVVELWGSGTPVREFLFADDLADACLLVMQRYDGDVPLNLGGGTPLSIRELAALVAETVGYAGAVRFDPREPDGMPRKVLDASALRTLGWQPATPLRDALGATYAWFLAHAAGGDASHAA